LNTSEFQTHWARWKKYRAEIRHRLTPSTEAAQLKQLAAWGAAKAIAAIERSITQGWQGLFNPEEHHDSQRRDKDAATRARSNGRKYRCDESADGDTGS
jgi:hypothetical protein